MIPAIIIIIEDDEEEKIYYEFNFRVPFFRLWVLSIIYNGSNMQMLEYESLRENQFLRIR